jgi:PAS domain S-box-containing protein/diguanylate cyclase (GGDEF)-like protein
LIEHNPMEIGRDVHGIKSLNRHALEQVVALSSDGILIVDAQDPNLSVVYANAAYEELTGYSVEELAGRSWSLVGRDAEGESELQRLKAAIGRAEPCRVIVADLRKDGTSWVVQVSAEPLHNGRGELKYFLCIHKPAAMTAAEHNGEAPLGEAELADSSGEVLLLQRELGRARQKIATLDRIDPATGLLRFGYFQETLRRDLAIARRDRRFVTLLLFTIVEFDAYRQTFGSKAADSCQRMIGAQIMRTLRRAGDLCARYDDSTLVAAVLGQTPEEVRHLAQQIADNVRKLGLHNPRAKVGRHIAIHSAVVGCPPATQEDAETLIARAVTELQGGSGAPRAALVS